MHKIISKHRYKVIQVVSVNINVFIAPGHEGKPPKCAAFWYLENYWADLIGFGVVVKVFVNKKYFMKFKSVVLSTLLPLEPIGGKTGLEGGANVVSRKLFSRFYRS